VRAVDPRHDPSRRRFAQPQEISRMLPISHRRSGGALRWCLPLLLCAAGASPAALAADGACATATAGTLTVANTQANPLTYAPDGNFALTIDLPPNYRQSHRDSYIRLRFHGVSAGGEDIQGDTASGDVLDAATHWATGRPGGTDEDHAYLIPGGDTRHLTVVHAGAPTCVDVALVRIADDPGDHTLPYAALGSAPRFAVYTPRDFPGLGQQFAEPTMGFNHATGNVFSINTIDVLRTHFDDSTTPARDTWESKPALESSVASLDPILTSDDDTGRIFSLNLTGPVSSADYSDDDGETWLPGGNGFPSSGVDHQSLVAGPFPASGIGAAIPHPLYPNAIYYCSQGIADAYCSRSNDGGVTFLPSIPIYVNEQCTGLHGHVKVAPDGSVYVPNKACNLDFPTFGNGVPGVVVSEDAGLTWSVKGVGTDATSASSHHGDPSVAIGRDNTIYFSYQSLDGHLKVAVSQDHGDSWFNILDVGALAGVHAAQFPAVVAGDAGRAAVAFIGTAFPDVPRIPSSTGPLQLVDAADGEIDFPGNWYGYIATTLDFGAHWAVTKVAPDDIIQGPAGVGGGGDNRNLLDFNDAIIDGEGRVLAAFADGCMGGCQLGYQGNFYGNARIAQIARQTGGPRMYAEFDPAEPAIPPAPRVSGYRTKDYVVLHIDADGGGLPVTGYAIHRNGALIAANYPQATYLDTTASDTGATYEYRVAAINARGAGAASNAFAPLVDEHAPVTAAVCTLPGQLWADQTGEPGAELPPMDIASLGIAEPADQPGKLVFTATALAPGGSAKIAFDHPDGSRYSIFIKPTGTTVGRTDGRWFSDATAELNNILATLADVPALDSSSGGTSAIYTAVIDKDAWGLKTGDVLRNVTVFGLLPTGNGQVFLRDFLGYDISQPIVGNDFCAKGAHLAPPVIDVVDVPVPAPVVQEDKGRFGGGLSLLSVMLLAGAATARRVLRARRRSR
jgi:hypothetical protein